MLYPFPLLDPYISPFVPPRQSSCKENPFNRKPSPAASPSAKKPPKGSKPMRPPAPGHGFPLIKRKVKGPFEQGLKANSVLSPKAVAVYRHCDGACVVKYCMGGGGWCLGEDGI